MLSLVFISWLVGLWCLTSLLTMFQLYHFNVYCLNESGLLDIILKGDQQLTISAYFGLSWLSAFQLNFVKNSLICLFSTKIGKTHYVSAKPTTYVVPLIKMEGHLLFQFKIYPFGIFKCFLAHLVGKYDFIGIVDVSLLRRSYL